jgi:predicted HicB family RNase H-like nuclease
MGSLQYHFRFSSLLMRQAAEEEAARLGWSLNRWMEHAIARALPEGWDQPQTVQ